MSELECPSSVLRHECFCSQAKTRAGIYIIGLPILGPLDSDQDRVPLAALVQAFGFELEPQHRLSWPDALHVADGGTSQPS